MPPPPPLPPPHLRSSRPPPNYSGVLIWGACRGAGVCPGGTSPRRATLRSPNPKPRASAAALLPRRSTWCAARQSAAPAHATRRDNSTIDSTDKNTSDDTKHESPCCNSRGPGRGKVPNKAYQERLQAEEMVNKILRPFH